VVEHHQSPISVEKNLQSSLQKNPQSPFHNHVTNRVLRRSGVLPSPPIAVVMCVSIAIPSSRGLCIKLLPASCLRIELVPATRLQIEHLPASSLSNDADGRKQKRVVRSMTVVVADEQADGSTTRQRRGGGGWSGRGEHRCGQ
jgi:hypothetical protein